MNYFDITEFIINPDAKVVPIDVVQKLDTYHKPILNAIRHVLGVPVIISKHSGYRSIEWDKKRGRDGSSQHTFIGKGAVDVRSNKKFEDLLDLLIDSDYMRVCYYPHHGFVHCDYKGWHRQYFEADKSGRWHFKKNR